MRNFSIFCPWFVYKWDKCEILRKDEAKTTFLKVSQLHARVHTCEKYAANIANGLIINEFSIKKVILKVKVKGKHVLKLA